VHDEAQRQSQRSEAVSAEEAERRAVAALCQVVFASNRLLYAP
jgi:hypothetical protein